MQNRFNTKAFLLFAFTQTALMSGAHAQPSFDCNKATSADEISICSDPVLADIDMLITDAYQSFEPSFQKKRAVAKALLADRISCRSDKACIAAVQSWTLFTYKYDGNRKPQPWVDRYAMALLGRKAAETAKQGASGVFPLPEQIGQCIPAKITGVTTRFGQPVDYSNTDAGTAIAYDNGLMQMSYDRVGLDEAQAGHRTILCLMSIPRDCPEGDTRGRIYYTLDLDTNTHWKLPDSQHSCGGA